jgi:hypothetical protein
MYETPEFRERLLSQFRQSPWFAGFQSSIVDYLQNLARENERDPTFGPRPEQLAFQVAMERAEPHLSSALLG